MNKVIEKIEIDKEILSTMPKNNKKNLLKYIDKINELKEEYNLLSEELYNEMNKRYKKIISVKQNPIIKENSIAISEIEELLEIIDTVKTSYEKIGMDKIIYKLGRFYKENLENINIEILNFLNKFNSIGIKLTCEDFDYSLYVYEYMKVFFQNIEDINSKEIKEKFETLYWKCPDLIIHIEMNIRNIFNKNEKIIDKFFENRKDKIIKSTNLKLDEIKEKNNNIKLEYEENFNKDKKIIIKSFLDGKLSIKDYETDKILDEYLKYIDNQDNIKENKEEIDCYLKKLLNNLLEYKNYLKFNYIFEDLKNKYKERQDILNKFNELKKELIVKEKELNKISKKINKKGIFNKNNKKEENEIQYNKKVIDIKELYKEIDKYDSYIKIIKNLNDSSTIYEVLNYASQFYQYLSEIIILNEETILSEDIDVRIEELRAFLKNPNNIIINNIAILEEKDIPIIIADIYKLSNLKVEKQDIINNLNALIESLQKLKNNYYIEKSKISIEDIKFICGFKKIMK